MGSLNLADGPRERDDFHTARSRLSQRRRGRRGRRPARVDVVDQRDRARRRPARAKRAGRVAPPLGECKAGLAWHPAIALEQGEHGQGPPFAKLAREPLGGMVASPERAVAVGRDEPKGACPRRRERLGDQVGCNRGEAAEPTLLPRGNEPSDGVVVGDRGAGRRECEPAARALAAARDRPRGGRTAALTERWSQARHALAAAVAELLAVGPTDGAAHR
jgi:hypothetical protein